MQARLRRLLTGALNMTREEASNAFLWQLTNEGDGRVGQATSAGKAELHA